MSQPDKNDAAPAAPVVAVDERADAPTAADAPSAVAKRTGGWWRFFVLSVLFLCIAAAALTWHAWRTLHTNVSQPDSVYSFIIPSGSTFTSVVARLAEHGAVRAPHYLLLYARLKDQSTQIKAGEYRLEGLASPLDLLELFITGRTTQHQFAIIEGWNFAQLRIALAAVDRLSAETTEMTDEELMEAIGSPELEPEGQFLPDTYSFVRGSSDLDLLRRAHVAMRDYVDLVWPERQLELPIKTPYQALTLASIVEKETAMSEERPLIATVFLSRLRIGMRLQTDPTVIYGLGDEFDGNLRRRHLRQDNPYNTYTRHGLPPTPIAMPGRAAIDAVLHPAEHDALYFVARGDGTGRHAFSRTLKQHNRAVNQYQRRRAQ